MPGQLLLVASLPSVAAVIAAGFASGWGAPARPAFLRDVSQSILDKMHMATSFHSIQHSLDESLRDNAADLSWDQEEHAIGAGASLQIALTARRLVRAVAIGPNR